jgi:MFS family permease
MSSTLEQSPATMPISIAMQRPHWRDTFAALKLRNYRLYVIAQFISNTAGWMQRIAVDWLVLELTDSVALVGLTIALQFLPTLLLGAYAGVLADRFPKRAVLLICQAGIALFNLVLAIVAIAGSPPLLLVYALVLAVGVLQVFDGPARSVFVVEMVGPRHLRNAISVNASIFHLGALIGPAISGVLIVAVGSGWAVGINVVAVAIGIVLLLAMRRSELVVAPRVASSKGQVREALRYVLRKPGLFWPLVMVAFIAVFAMPMPALLAGMADTVYFTGPQGYGLYNSLAAVGALAGALASTRRASLRLRTIIFGATLYGLSLVLAGLAPFYPMFLGMLVVVGLTRLLTNTAAETMVQLSSNMAIRGRIMAFWVLVIVGGQAVGGPLMGWIAEALGSRTALVISGAVPAAAGIVIAIALARTGRLTVRVSVRKGRWVAIVPRVA